MAPGSGEAMMMAARTWYRAATHVLRSSTLMSDPRLSICHHNIPCGSRPRLSTFSYNTHLKGGPAEAQIPQIAEF